VTPRGRPDAEGGGHDATDDATAWALAAREGDPVAAAAFIRATQADVWRFVASLTEPADADDLTQETFLRAFRALTSFEGRASVRTWLLAIARRVCADHIRSAVRARRLVARVAAVEPRQEFDAPDLAAPVAAAQLLARLGTDQREAFVLTQVLGLSYDEAARTLGVPVGTIRSRVARARGQLLSDVQQTLAG
jgi:RNA polymerase sigma-70 factor, ECF subfamily